jgi:signal transduction histidine kinase
MNLKSLYHGILILLILFFSSGCQPDRIEKKLPIAVKGVLDLEDWNFSEDPPVNLNGEWQFYWNQLLDPEAFNNGSHLEQTGFITLPGIWNDYQVEGEAINGKGFATFRLEIKLENQRESLALKILDMATAYKIWINNDLVLSNGLVGNNAENSQAQFLPQTARIRSSSDKIFVTLQISNYQHKKGGAWTTILFGSEQNIREKRENRLAINLFLFGSLMIMAFYHFGLYILRRNEPSPLFFSFVCGLIALRTLLVDERFLNHLFPDFSWEILQKLEYITFYISIPCFAMFLTSLFSEFSKRVIWIALLVSTFFSVFTLVTPTGIFSYGLVYYEYFLVGIAIYGLYGFVRVLLNKREGAIWTTCGFAILLITVLVDILAVNGLIPNVNISSTGLFLFIFFQSIMMSKRFSTAFSKLELLSRELVLSNQTKDEFLAARKKAEEKNIEANKRLMVILDSVPADIYISDMETYEILYLNKQMKESFGEDLVGEICWKTFRNGVAPCLHCTNPILLDENKESTGVKIWEVQNPVNYKYYINHDRAIRWVDDKYVRIQIATDITDRKAAEESLRKANDELELIVEERTTDYKKAKEESEQANRLKSEFLGNMSHELRTPMHGILSYSKFGMDKFDKINREKILHYFKQINESGNRLMVFLNDLLDLSKLESGKEVYKMASIDIWQLAKNIVSGMISEWEEKNLKAIIEEPSIKTKIDCDEFKIAQVIQNLLANAFKFTEANRKISISFGSGELPSGKRSYDKEIVPAITMAIKDEGIGIPENELGLVFDKFIQSSKTNTGAGGTGLGLAICKEIIEAHNGKIWAENNKNEGSTLSFMIPIKQEMN